MRLFLSVAILVVGVIVAQAADENDWETAAGGKMAFDVASVKAAKDFAPPNFPLSAEAAYVPGGRLTATFPLTTYITFAYKLGLSADQTRAMIAGLPKWVGTDRYEIRAQAGRDATKDQLRLMMQALMADRFHLKVHFETHEGPVMAMVLDKPGKLGPKLIPHAQGPECPDYTSEGLRAPSKAGDAYPSMCGVTAARMPAGGLVMLGSRDTTLQLLANGMQGEAGLPVIDRTGLTGKFDYTLEYAGQFGPTAPVAADAPAPSDNGGPTFLQAVREQLGLKLTPARAEVKTLVIDRVERPSEN